MFNARKLQNHKYILNCIYNVFVWNFGNSVEKYKKIKSLE